MGAQTVTVTISLEKDHKLRVPRPRSPTVSSCLRSSPKFTDKDGVLCSSTEEMKASINLDYRAILFQQVEVFLAPSEEMCDDKQNISNEEMKAKQVNERISC